MNIVITFAVGLVISIAIFVTGLVIGFIGGCYSSVASIRKDGYEMDIDAKNQWLIWRREQ